MNSIDEVLLKGMGVIIILLMLCTTCVVIRVVTLSIQQEKDEKVAMEQSYETYYNGDQIDLDHVDFSQYSVSIDKKNKRVYLTDKQSIPNTLFVPIFSK